MRQFRTSRRSSYREMEYSWCVDRTVIYMCVRVCIKPKAHTFIFTQIFLNNHIWTFSLWIWDGLRKADGVGRSCTTSCWVLWWDTFSDWALQLVTLCSRDLPLWLSAVRGHLVAAGWQLWKTTWEKNRDLIQGSQINLGKSITRTEAQLPDWTGGGDLYLEQQRVVLVENFWMENTA